MKARAVTASALASLGRALCPGLHDVGRCDSRLPSAVSHSSPFLPRDAGSRSGSGARSLLKLTSYGPSSTCPTGHTNCPDSGAPCDVNLLTDRNNRGECGINCPESTSTREKYECVDGRCACDVVPSRPAHARLHDGLLHTGYEANPLSDDHCGVLCHQAHGPEQALRFARLSRASFNAAAAPASFGAMTTASIRARTISELRACGTECD